MGSKGRWPFPGPGLLHPDPYGPGIHPPAGAFHFDMMPPPEVIEEKLATQHVEMQRLATENGRLAATHSSLRQELAVGQQELHRLQNHMSAVKSEQEQQMSALLDKITKMEADLKSSDAVKVELQQAHAEAQNLFAVRQDLSSQAQQLTQDLQRSHGDAQQIPAFISELDALRQEYQHCRSTYDYERKLRIDHHESLQVMQKNYGSMVREVEKLRAELANTTSYDRSGNNALGTQLGAPVPLKENSIPGIHSVGPSAYGEGNSVSQGRGPSGSINEHAGSAGGPASSRPGYDASRGPNYDASRSFVYDASRLSASQGGNYDGPKGTVYDAPRAGDTQSTGAAGKSPTTYGSMQAPSKYGVAQTSLAYGSVQQSIYGSQQPPYGSPHQPAYAPTQQAAYASAQYPTYGSAPQHPTIQQSTYASGQQTVYGSVAHQSQGSEKKLPSRAGGYEAPRSVNYSLSR